MTRNEIKAALAGDYRRAYTVYESMELPSQAANPGITNERRK